jgi:hypothetical protein
VYKQPKPTAEEIWAALVALSRHEPIKDLSQRIGRAPATIKGWRGKYDAVKSLAKLRPLVAPAASRYVQLMQQLFKEKWRAGSSGFEWDRADLPRMAKDLGIIVPQNLGDNIYAIRHGREDLPLEIRQLAPSGKSWLLLPNGRSKYRFVLASRAFLDPAPRIAPIDIPDSTPQLVAKHALNDEQATLARIRYCRLIDIFLGLASYQLQSHMRTTVAHFNGAQTELDEIYVGVDGEGMQHVIPIQAKSATERIGVIQIITDHFACAEKFPKMWARTIVAKIVKTEEHATCGRIFTIALIEAKVSNSYNVRKIREQHYRLIPAAMM